MVDNNENFFGEPIHSYTRKQAIEDGMLVDITDLAKEAGFNFPVAITIGVFGEAVECSEQDSADGQDEKGRTWDILNVLHFAIRRDTTSSSRIDFSVAVYKNGRTEEVDLYALCGPGDNAEPVITIMLPHED